MFNYVTATRALDALAARAGVDWWIDDAKVLQFKTPATVNAPFTLDWTKHGPLGAVPKLIAGAHTYRNRQYIIGGKTTTDTQVAEFQGDTKTQTFPVSFPIVQVPTVKVDAAAKTVGIRGLNTGKDWYWSKGSEIVSQDHADTPLSASEVLEVTYVGEYPIVTITDHTDEQTRIAAVEGSGSGIVSHVHEDSGIASIADASSLAGTLLATYAQQARAIIFSTTTAGLEVGQLATVNLPELGVSSEDFLIWKIDISDLGATELQYQVTALDGPAEVSWTTFFTELARVASEALLIRENIDENETLIITTTTDESWTWAEVVNQTVYACPTPGTVQYPATTLYPC